jgi:hypothetical protein
MRAGHEVEGPLNERKVLRAAVDVLRERMPPGWNLYASPGELLEGRRVDVVLRVTSPDEAEAVLIVEARTTLEARDLANVREQLNHQTEAVPRSRGMVVARYLARPVRERLSASGLSYADATGNIRVQTSRPGLFISDHGADRDPWRGPGRPRDSLKGEPAARVVRALLDHHGPWPMRRLVDVSGTSTGSAYRVIELLESQGLVSKDVDGKLNVPAWPALLRRWGEDYQFARTNKVTRWIAPRGVEHFLDRLRKSETDGYAVTGSVAANVWAAYAPARSAMVYAVEPWRVAEGWGLREAETGVNVLLAEPAYSVVLARRIETPDGLMLAAPTQVAADLMTGPGRSPSEAEALIDWAQHSPDFTNWKRANERSGR